MTADTLALRLADAHRRSRAAAARVQAEHARRAPAHSDQATPAQLGVALEMFFALAERSDAAAAGAALAADDATRIGDYGLQVLADLIAWAGQLDLAEERSALLSSAPAMGEWIAGQGGELRTPEPVVDALALAANQTSDPAQLAELVSLMTRILNAFSRALKGDLESANPGRPWRILNLNRAIAATRTHDPALMSQVYDELVQVLPGEAPRFFAEGLDQMERLNYPAEVRALVERYYRDWALRKMH